MESSSPQMRPGLVVDPIIGKHRIVHCDATRQYFRVGSREADFFESLDGSRQVEQLRAENAQGFSPEQVDRLVAWFEAQGLLGIEAQAAVKESVAWYVQIWRFIIRPDQFRFHLYDPDRLLDRFRGAIDLLFSRVAIGCYLMILLAPAIVYVVRPELATRAAQQPQTFSIAMWVAFYFSILIMIGLHEMAHALACKHFGGKVNKIGLMFMFLSPVVYCDVSDSWRFRSANHKVVVAVAGIFLQLLLTSAGLTLWQFTGSPFVLKFVAFNTVIALMNFFPFIKLDGYWILVHLLDEPNLRTKGLKAVDLSLRKLFGRGQPSASQPVTPLITAYGFGHALAIPFFWCLGLYGLYHFMSQASVSAALALVAVFACALCYRATRFVMTFGRTTLS